MTDYFSWYEDTDNLVIDSIIASTVYAYIGGKKVLLFIRIPLLWEYLNSITYKEMEVLIAKKLQGNRKKEITYIKEGMSDYYKHFVIKESMSLVSLGIKRNKEHVSDSQTKSKTAW